jgi:N-acetylneuraminate synthase/N,N'-diacetyllegionaminate synthase
MPRYKFASKLNNKVILERRRVGPGEPVFIIAEVGINHNSSIRLAKRLIDKAVSCGVDCVKFQTFRTEEFMADRSMVYEYSSRGRRVRENMFSMFKRLELPIAWHRELFTYCRKKKIIPLTSVADPESAEAVNRLGVAAFKLSSEDLINLPLVEYVAKKRKPLIISTGMADEEEIEDVLKILYKYNCQNVIFLHCVSVYPTPVEEANLLRMRALAEKVKGVVGYSDHTLGVTAAIGAVALGASVIEKHFTLDRRMPGPDHSLSSDPEELLRLVRAIREIEKMLGSQDIKPSATECKTRLQFRRSIVAKENLPKGHLLNKQDLALKRPGTGLKAREMQKLIGKRLTKDISENKQITYKSIR